MSRQGLACHRTIYELADPRARLAHQRGKATGLVRPPRSERSNDRMARLLDLIRHAGLIPRRSVLNHPLVRPRKASTGITASIAKPTENAGTSKPSGTREHSAALSKAIDISLSLLRQPSSSGLWTGGAGGDRSQ